MIYEDKDDYFKELYSESLGVEVGYFNDLHHHSHGGTDRMVFDGKLILEIKHIDSYISKNDLLKIKNCNSEEIGYIVFGIRDSNDYAEMSVFTSDEILFIWGEYRKTGVYPDLLGTHILVLKEEYATVYLDKYYQTSSLWGGFVHEDSTVELSFDKGEIILPENEVKFPTEMNMRNSYQSVLSGNIYDNFLKNYHQLELVFNFIFIMKLKKTEINNLKDVNEIYKDISKNEIESIKYMVSKYADNKLEYIKIILDAFSNHKDISDEIFYDYGKESNPLKDSVSRDKFNEFIIECNTVPLNTIGDFFNIAKNIKFKSKFDDFTKFIDNFTSYIIYRVRCSIAHNKLSEFIFMPNDENHFKFMSDISVPILRQVVIDIFSNSEFKSIFD